MKHLIAALAVLFVFVAPAYTAAQTTPNVINPGTLSFIVSEDHALLNGYTAGFFLPGAEAPFMTVDIGKPVPDANGLAITPINTRPVKFDVNITVRLMSVAEGASSEWSEPSNPFDRKPGPPTKPIVAGKR